MAQTALVRGQIAYVNPESGCGFITTEDTEQDALFLRSSVEGSIPDVGEDVRFELVEPSVNSYPVAVPV
jgi:cold shock CspA family protein